LSEPPALGVVSVLEIKAGTAHLLTPPEPGCPAGDPGFAGGSHKGLMMRRSRYALTGFAVGVAMAFSVTASVDATAGQSHAVRHRAKRGSICGNPTIACKTSASFQPHDLQFRVPANSVIFDTELFYAIILKSIPASEEDCNAFVPETERLAAQSLLPDRKVFSSRCVEPGELFYTNVGSKHRIMAVYAGTTLAEAKRVLEAVKVTGKFPGAYMRRMRTGFNGT